MGRETTQPHGRELYAFQNLGKAVRLLAQGQGKLQDRLGRAYLAIHVLRASDFPPPLDDDFVWIKNQLTRFKSERDDEGDVEATLSKIRSPTPEKIAKRFVDVYMKLVNHYLFGSELERSDLDTTNRKATRKTGAPPK